MMNMLPRGGWQPDPKGPGADPYGKDGHPPYPETDDEEDSVYAEYTADFVESQQDAREPLHRTWQQNILFLLGQQWIEYDVLTGSFTIPKVSNWKERPVVNLLRPYFKHVLAKVTKERPVPISIPSSTEPDDVQSALLGDDVLRAKWQELHMARTIRRSLAWVGPTGNGAVMPYWNEDTGRVIPLTAPVQAMRVDPMSGLPVMDPEIGQPMVDIVECPCDENGDPILDEMGNYDLEAQPHFVDEGDIGYKVFSPFHVYVNEDAEAPEDVREVVVIDPMTLREFYRRFPDAPEGIAPDSDGSVDDLETLVEGLISGAGGADTHFVGSLTESEPAEKVRVYYYYSRPTPAFPKGRHWVVAGRELLVEPTELPDGIWPQLVFLGDIEVPGQFWKASTMTDAVGLQREYNEANAFIKEHHNLLLRGKWLVPIGSNIRRGQITSEPGEVIQHTPGLPPKMAELRPLPEAVYTERKRILDDFQLVTGLYRISMGGSPPPGVTSGRAFLTMQEADDSDFGPFLNMLEEAMAEIGMLTLRIIQQRYDEERLIRVAGENRRYRVRAFKGADLRGVSDVEVQQGSTFPWNRVAKQDMIVQLARDVPAVFMDPETGAFDVEKFRDALPVGGIGMVASSGDEDISQAFREEEIYESWDGTDAQILPKPLPWQNHRVHMRQHKKVLNSAAFERWTPFAKIAFIQHWKETAVMLQQQMAAIAALTPGQPGQEEEPGTQGKQEPPGAPPPQDQAGP